MSELLRMQMLAGLITESQYKFKLLNECFIVDTFMDLFNENPKIYSILKGNLIDMYGNVRDDLESKEDIAEDFTASGGALGYDGIWDWNKSRVLEFFKDLQEINTLKDPSTYSLLEKEIEKTHKVFTADYMNNMIRKVGDRMEKIHGNDWWYETAMEELEFIKKGLTQKDFQTRHKNPPPKTCGI